MRTVVGTLFLLLSAPFWVPFAIIAYAWRCAGEVLVGVIDELERRGGKP